MPAPRPYHHGDLKATLLELGVQVLAEDGAQGLSLRKVARLAGVSHNAPYMHFPDKGALLSAIADQGFVQLGAQMRASVAQAAPGSVAQLHALAAAYVRFATGQPHHLSVMFPGPESVATLPGAVAGQTFAVLEEAIRAGQASGVIRSGDPGLLAGTFWALMHGVATLLIARRLSQAVPAGQAVEAVTPAMLDLLLDGLRAQN